MMKNRAAFELLLREQLPDLPQPTFDAILDSKFTMLAALQRYAEMSRKELDDVELLVILTARTLILAHKLRCNAST